MISSVSNSLFKQVVSLKSKKSRNETGLFVIEGEKFVDEISNDFEIVYLVASESFASFKNASKYLKYGNCHIFKDYIFAKVSDTISPQGILAVCKQKKNNNFALKNKNAFILIGQRICDPGNLGTIIRTADACGCDGVVLSEGSTDLYNPKVLRSTAGSIFHLPIATDVQLLSYISSLKSQGITIVAAHLKGQCLPYEVDFKKSCAILVGNEATGLSDNIANQADVLVKIPMPGKAESLNASVACGVLLYEVVRQRIGS